jgi:outer membrane protein assembly factor BamA
MVSKRILFLFFIAFCLLFIQSCSSTKFVPEGERLLADAQVKSDVKGFSGYKMNPYIKQKPNYKTFSLIKIPLIIYNASGEDTTKWINRTLRRAGEAPVLYDSTMVDKTVDDLQRIMTNKGYLHAEVDTIIKYGKKKVNITYDIKGGEPYKIRNYEINVPDSAIAKEFIIPDYMKKRSRRLANRYSLNVDSVLARSSLVKKDDLFDLDVLDAERDRITSFFRRAGYYDFTKEYVGFVADTAVGNKYVDLELSLLPNIQNVRNSNQPGIASSHQQYIVKEVNLYIDYNPLEDGDIANYQTSNIYERNGFKIYYGVRGEYIKPFILINSCFIRPGELFNENMTTMTYNAFSQLHILKNVNIRYTVIENDSIPQLRCTITCVPDKKQGISAEIEGTNSGGSFGVEAGLGYLHRNAFRGSELFNVRLKGAYEAVSPSFTNFNDNYFEIGGETSLTFPRFIFPFLNGDFRRRVNASTQFNANYIYQRRPGYFTRTIMSSGVKYIWQERRQNSTRHVVDLIDVSYIHIPTLNAAFDSTLSVNARKYSFTDQFVVSAGYTFSKTNLNQVQASRRAGPIYSIRASFETAGNLLSLIALAADLKKNEVGAKEIFGTPFAQYVRGTADYSQTIHLNERNSIAWRVGGGLAYPYGNFREIPIQKRFFSGGANSVRGWGVRELGPGSFSPKDKAYDNFFYHSGDIRFDANIEYRSKLFWILELGAFLDAGNVWSVRNTEDVEGGKFKFNSFYKEIALAWGLGMRFDFDFVLIRLDCGWKIYNPEKGENIERWPVKDPFKFSKNTAFHIAVGYPF